MAAPKEPVKVLVLYTGGTIGMTRNENNVLAPMDNEFKRTLLGYPSMHDPAYARLFDDDLDMFALPFVEGEKKRIRYKIIKFDPLLDSSNMGMKDWIKIALSIKESYELYGGFVVLHGTDTLCYTAAALSFILENLRKTVVVTGAQIPIFETRTDGKDNLISSLIIAGRNTIPEVCVLFNNQLFRGNRTVKESNNTLTPFRSPNLAPLAKLGIKIVIEESLVRKNPSGKPFNVFERLVGNVDLIYLHPYISTETVRDILRSKQGVILLTYGAGNIPTNRTDLVQELRQAAEKGVLMVNCTQCYEGTISDDYETGRELESHGIVSGVDMTLEAALVKLSYVLGHTEWSHEEKKDKMKSNICGELTAELNKTK